MKNNKKDLYVKIYNILEEKQMFPDKFLEIEEKYGLILFGGAVRDYIIDSQNYNPRDFDFIITQVADVNIVKDILLKYFDRGEVTYNQFGGMKIVKSSFSIDLWRFEDTHAFKLGLIETNYQNLLKTVFLNIDAYAYDLYRKEYIGDCNLNSFPEIIDILLYDKQNINLNLLRALVYSKKYNIPISDRLKQILKDRLKDSDEKKNIEKMQIHHFREKILDLDEIQIKYMEE